MTEQIWVVISCDLIYYKLRELVDAGDYEQASQLSYGLNAIMDKIKSLIQARGGSLLLSMYDRQVLMLSSAVAEELPNILAGYQELFGKNMAVGLGLTLKEASWAVRRSKGSGEIEFYDPKDVAFDEAQDITKDEPNGAVDFSAVLPPNLFDPLLPEPKKQGQEPSYKRSTIDQDLQGEAKLLQGIISILGGGQVEQQIQQMQQQIQQQQQSPRNLLESLHGERLPNQQQQQGQEQQSKPQGKEETKKEEIPENKSKNEIEPKEDETTKLGNLLSQVKEVIPQLMGLADSNPEAFKSSMNIVNKIIKLAKLNREAKKSEYYEEFNELKKNVDELQKAKDWKPRFKKEHIDYPLGTVLGNKKLVTVNGRKTWRQMGSGQVMDEQGQAISVKASNAQSEKDQSGK